MFFYVCSIRKTSLADITRISNILVFYQNVAMQTTLQKERQITFFTTIPCLHISMLGSNVYIQITTLSACIITEVASVSHPCMFVFHMVSQCVFIFCHIFTLITFISFIQMNGLDVFIDTFFL